VARVLIVDDQPEVRTLLAAVVKRAGHDVLVAADVPAAWSQLEQKPHLIFADIDMPGETGVQLVLRLRHHPTCAHVPVVFVTAYRERAAALVRADPAVLEVIDKPFRIEAIAAALQRVFGPEAAA
jgi:CheY-like chemotaxis protein